MQQPALLGRQHEHEPHHDGESRIVERGFRYAFEQGSVAVPVKVVETGNSFADATHAGPPKSSETKAIMLLISRDFEHL